MGSQAWRAPYRVAVLLPTYIVSAHEVAHGMVRFSRRSGQFEFHDLPFIEHQEIPSKLKRGRTDGVVLWLSPVDFEEIRREMPANLPMVNIGPDPLGADIGMVRTRDEAMVDLAVTHLRGAGYERLAVVGLGDSPAGRKRFELLRKLVSPRPSQVAAFDMHWPAQEESPDARSSPALERWLKSLDRPVGIAALHGYFAQCILLACRNVGLDVPRDVGILSLVDDRWCQFGDPLISAVRASYRKIGYEAMKLLAGMLQRREPRGGVTELPPRDVITRDSTHHLERRGRPILRALSYIEEHAAEGITVADVVRTTQTMSRRKFYDEFSRQVGRSPAEHIRRVKVAMARQLLTQSTLSMARIASMSGFANATQFGTAFRRATGQTPSDYRKKKQR
jgi:LacI family transcriptional regulator